MSMWDKIRGKGAAGHAAGMDALSPDTNSTPKDRAASQQPNATADSIGKYPLEYDVPTLSDRRDKWTAWIATIGLMASLALNALLVAGIFALLPLKEVQPMFVQFADRTDRMVSIRPITTIDPTTMEKITEANIRNYVIWRQSIISNGEEQANRWAEGGYISQTTPRQDYQTFIVGIRDILTKFRAEDLVRDIEIIRVNKSITATSSNVFEVEFQAIDKRGDGPDAPVISKSLFVAQLSVSYVQSNDIPYEKRLVNPMGFFVSSYKVIKKEGG